ncbi:MAG: alpha-1,4-glucan--maltose-1-phosphate maltosyltransferase [Flavobacteriaceae bacterium]|nr:alpha-1,4-glucan--maltose-1-phosphate maltosyltransferase [Flavobacteriaceae bacterium]
MHTQKRVVIDYVYPQINDGDFFIKRVIGEIINVTAHVIGDGHDLISASVRYKHENERNWREARMHHVMNDEWSASFVVEKQGLYSFKVEGWVDHTLNWQHGIHRKIDDGQYVISELLEGADYLKLVKKKSNKTEAAYLQECIDAFINTDRYEQAVGMATSGELHELLYKYPLKKFAINSKTYQVFVDRERARFSTWYEFFPRSASPEPDKHGTFKDCIPLLPRIAKMGFDTVYLPPIHPIGEVNRKGKNNTNDAQHGDVGSTWGIGSQHGGHKDIHPELGTLDDFKELIKAAQNLNMEIALDYALQAAPDHPWVKEHPEWFKWRPDGTVQYAENPPKKYQDILPIYWESKEYKALWQECLDVLMYWIACGVKIFRVDNPHTKPFYFWEWVISEIKAKHPDVLFLAEAFTKPKVMEQLAKRGFSQSYTYFTWRNTRQELIDYVVELTQTDRAEYMRPNFWPNTPDINPFHLQGANEAKFLQRYVLAATLSSNTGIYGPVYEQMISDALPGREEYVNSEKYQICNYDWNLENKLTTLIGKINWIRKEQPALRQTNNIRFCHIENENIMAFYKWDQDKTNEVLIIISLDPYYMQSGMVQVPLAEFNLWDGQGFEVHDLVTGNSYHWREEWNYVELHPALPFHIFHIVK